MTKPFLLFGLFSAGLFLNGCQSAATADLKTQKEQPIVQQTPNKSANIAETAAKVGKLKVDSQAVNFKGVSFNYNPRIFDKVEPEDIDYEVPLESEDSKPGENFPGHISFNLRIAKQNRTATLKIISLADYRRMYPASLSYTKTFNENIKNLQRVLKDEKIRVDGEAPFIPFYDAHQTITARVKHFSFETGNGFFFLTQYNQDFANIVNNDELTYFYQGISADGKKYVLAEFPASAPFLPKDNQAEQFEGYKLPITYDELDEKAHRQYIAKITKRLENLPPDKFEPSLKYFEEIISSLEF